VGRQPSSNFCELFLLGIAGLKRGTFENAVAAVCWINKSKEFRKVLLINHGSLARIVREILLLIHQNTCNTFFI